MKDAIKSLAQMIDASYTEPTAALSEKALPLAEELLKRKPQSKDRAYIYYCMANAWHRISYEKGNTWDWASEPLEKEIFYLRKSIIEKDFYTHPKELQAMVYTNLGNYLSTAGRTYEAVEYWNIALRLFPNFGMTLLGKAQGLTAYANAMLEGEDRIKIFLYCEELYKRAIASGTTYSNLANLIQRETVGLTNFLNQFKVSRDILDRNPKSFKYKSKKEKEYRCWCLRHSLIMNPLNLIEHYKEITDSTHIPSITTPTGSSMPIYYPYFNQLKQEYTTARYLCFEGEEEQRKSHFSDKSVYIIDALDYTTHNIHFEKIKLAFKTAYSVLDKIAFFLNDYFDLKQNSNFNFRNIWYENTNKGLESGSLLKVFEGRENWPLRGLFWLSKDFAFTDKEKYAIEPDAENLKNIRDYMEHKFFRITMMCSNGEIPSITELDLINKTIKILKLTNAALAYLSVAVAIEEHKKRKSDKKEGIVMPINMHSLKR